MQNLKQISQSIRLDNLSLPELVETSLRNEKTKLSSAGALIVEIQKPGVVQRKLVNDASIHDIRCPKNSVLAITNKEFHHLWQTVRDNLANGISFRQHLHFGIDPSIALPIELNTKYAWHAIASFSLCHKPKLFNTRDLPVWKIFWVPHDYLPEKDRPKIENGIILINPGSRKILVGGNISPGEMRRSLLMVLGLILPDKNAIPLHGASALSNKTVLTFLGPPGTNKTAWAMQSGELIGERGLFLSHRGIDRLGDGCRIRLSSNMPLRGGGLFAFGTLIEGAKLKYDRSLSDTDNPEKPIHASIDITAVSSVSSPVFDGPKKIAILVNDSLGVLPVISSITREQALAWFLIGYSSEEIAGNNLKTNNPHFAAGFFDGLLLRPVHKYIDILDDLCDHFQTQFFLVNVGFRSEKRTERKILSTDQRLEIIHKIKTCESWTNYSYFNARIPKGVSKTGLNWDASEAWSQRLNYDSAYNKLCELIKDQLKKYKVEDRFLNCLGLIQC